MYSVSQLDAAEKMLDLIAAVRDGKVIEGRSTQEVLLTDPPQKPRWFVADPAKGFNLSRFEYRIQPEVQKPKEIWVNEYRDMSQWYCHETKDIARSSADDGADREAVHYREVIPEVDKLVIDVLKRVSTMTAESGYQKTLSNDALKALKALGHAD